MAEHPDHLATFNLRVLKALGLEDQPVISLSISLFQGSPPIVNIGLMPTDEAGDRVAEVLEQCRFAPTPIELETDPNPPEPD